MSCCHVMNAMLHCTIALLQGPCKDQVQGPLHCGFVQELQGPLHCGYVQELQGPPRRGYWRGWYFIISMSFVQTHASHHVCLFLPKRQEKYMCGLMLLLCSIAAVSDVGGNHTCDEHGVFT